MEKLKAGIAGGAGYTGGELLRILLNHPRVAIAFVHSKSNAGHPISKAHADLAGDTDLRFTDELHQNIDVLFLCVGHHEANKFLAENRFPATVRIIDLSQDFRLAATSVVGDRLFVYGLPELNRDRIREAANIANPGCFATSIQLGLLPLAAAGLLSEVYTTGITGSTGAGQGLTPSSHFSWRANNIQAYKTLTHQHVAEILQSLSQLQPGLADGAERLNFIPWRGDFTRGIFISSQMYNTMPLAELQALYRDYYAAHPFVHLSDESIYLKQVVNTNKCMIQLEKVGTRLVVHSAIDNLTKGASGQAVQNMNLMFGFDETEGLRLKANAF